MGTQVLLDPSKTAHLQIQTYLGTIMTPDELLTEIVAKGTGPDHEDLIDVLGAVLEIHKPTRKNECSFCYKLSNGIVNLMPYPCPTVKAIERELG
jgi:hypothetical protein